MSEKEIKPEKKEIKFTKIELIKSGKWNKYALSALLEDGKEYSISEVEKLIKKG